MNAYYESRLLLRTVRATYDAALEPWDLSAKEAAVLTTLAAAPGGMLVKALIVAVGVTGAATDLIDRLSERGLLERRPHPDDRRAVLVTLTPAGTTTARAIGPALQDADRTARELLLSAADAWMADSVKEAI